MLIPPVWNKILKIWNTLSTYKQNYNAAKIVENFFLPQEAGAFRNNIEKKQQKPRPKLKKHVTIYR